MRQLEKWATAGLPAGAASLFLEAATRPFASTGSDPETPNSRLLHLLWHSPTTISPAEVESIFARLPDDECRACALRLLAERPGRQTSEALARLLMACRGGTLPVVHWPFLLPLEKVPRDPDVLVAPMIDLLREAIYAGAVGEVLLGYAKARLLDDDHRQTCSRLITPQATALIARVDTILSDRGVAHRWDPDCLEARTETSILLDLLGQLEQLDSGAAFRRATESLEPNLQLWGVIGLLRLGVPVPETAILRIAEWRDCRTALARNLAAVGRMDLFPEVFHNQQSIAEALMAEWLLFPTELGQTPDEIKALGTFEVDADEGVADVYAFAFRMHPPHWLSGKDWVVGIAGPFLRSQRPTFKSLAGAFSHFEKLSEKAVEQHVVALIEYLQQLSTKEKT